MGIGEKTRKEAEGMLVSLWNDHWKEAKEAFGKADDSGLTVSISVSMKAKEGKIHLKTNIGFVSDRVKDELEIDIDEAQSSLPGMEPKATNKKNKK